MGLVREFHLSISEGCDDRIEKGNPCFIPHHSASHAVKHFRRQRRRIILMLSRNNLVAKRKTMLLSVKFLDAVINIYINLTQY
jgi:hypothetical protein